MAYIGSNVLLGVYGICGGPSLPPLLLATWPCFLSSWSASGGLRLQDKLVRKPALGCISAFCFTDLGSLFRRVLLSLGLFSWSGKTHRGKSRPGWDKKEATSVWEPGVSVANGTLRKRALLGFSGGPALFLFPPPHCSTPISQTEGY